MPKSAAISLLLGALLGAAPRAAGAREPHGVQTLSAADRAALAAGRTISRPLRFSKGKDGHYVGGVSYQVVRATPAEVLRALSDVGALPQALPHTQSAELVSSAGRSARIELTQGAAPFFVTYTVHLEQTGSGDAIRFWLDPERPHGVRDVWGFFRVTPFGKDQSMVTVAAAVDMGPGIARLLFEDRVERTILRAPRQIREFVEPRALALAR